MGKNMRNWLMASLFLGSFMLIVLSACSEDTSLPDWQLFKEKHPDLGELATKKLKRAFRLYEDKKKAEESYALMEKYMQDGDRDPLLLYKMGMLQQYSGREETAKNLYRESLENIESLYPAHRYRYTGWINLAKLAFQEKKYEKVIRLLKRARKAGADDETVFYRLGRAFLRLEQYDTAAAYLEKSGLLMARYYLGMAHFKNGNEEQARKVLTDFLDEKPMFWQAWADLGHLYLKEARRKEGEGKNEQLSRAQTCYLNVYKILDKRLSGMGQSEKAMRIYKKRERYREYIGFINNQLNKPDTAEKKLPPVLTGTNTQIQPGNLQLHDQMN